MRKSYSVILCFLMCIPLLQAQHNTNDTGKINNLKTYQMSGDISNIRIYFNQGQNNCLLMQLDTDISLVNEIRLLIQASIELYENQIQELKLNF